MVWAKGNRRGIVGWLFVALACGSATSLGCQRTIAPPAPVSSDQAQGVDSAYVKWLEERSMLFQARARAKRVSGQGIQWRHPYGARQTRRAVQRASVWLLDFGGSVIPRPGHSVISTWADPDLWQALRQVGIDLLHTGPVNRAGAIRGRDYIPSSDGGFDPISLEIDPQFGTEGDYRRLVQVAADHQGLIAADLVPLHTGMGADFRLALMGYQDYPGMYTMIEIRKEDRPLLPSADGPWTCVPVSKDVAERLTNKGYLPGLINNNDAVSNARQLSGWAASGEVSGVDGTPRRWVYLHYFKPGQPSLNWLDPSFAGPRAVAGDIVHQVQDRGASVLRLDAVPFLGIEPEPGKPLSRHYLHPYSVNATNELAFLIRKLGGWSFQELNVPLVELKKYTANGPDLSYDFFTRAQCLHALLTEDASLLRQAFQFLLEAGIEPLTLVHDLQNHDEITYQLVELDHRKDQEFTLGGRRVTGRQLREQMLQEMRARAAGPAAPHNKLYRPEKDGVATTFAGFVAAALKVRDPWNGKPEQLEQIKKGHLLLALANAMQPGVFSLSSWDLVGALPVPESEVEKWVGSGDYRWVNRGGVDLMGANPAVAKSVDGLPRAKVLYGSLPRQLKDPESFVSKLQKILTARKKYRIAEAEMIAVPEVKNSGVCLLILKLPESKTIAVTAANFARAEVEEVLDLTQVSGLPVAPHGGYRVVDAVAGPTDGQVLAHGRSLRIKLPALTGKTLVISGPSP